MRRRLAPAIVGCVAVSSCYVATHYEGWRYQGGRLVNNGILTRPRFEAPFPSIRFNVAATYEFSFTRFPDDDAVVMLVTPQEPSVDSIERLKTEVHIRVVDQDNRIRCEGTGWPAGKGAQQLVVTSSVSVIGLWHTGCARLQLRACAPCRLYIGIGPVDPKTPAIILIPTLQGGAWEWL